MKSTLLNVDVSALFPYLCSIYVSHDSLVSNSVLSKVPTSSLQKSNIWEKGNEREREKRKKNKWEEEGRKQKNNEVVGGRSEKSLVQNRTRCENPVSWRLVKGPILLFFSGKSIVFSLFIFQLTVPGSRSANHSGWDLCGGGERGGERTWHLSLQMMERTHGLQSKINLHVTNVLSLVVIINSCSWSVSFKIQQRDHKPRGHCSSVW